MARPSVAKERVEQILDALERCIMRQGISATSLENIAEEANMKRTILRHYIGNRDQIIAALSARWQLRYSEQWQQTLAYLPSQQPVNYLLDILFAERTDEYLLQSVINEAIFAEGKRLPEVKQHITQSMQEFIEVVASIISRQYPQAATEQLTIVAHGIYANYLAYESLLPMQPSQVTINAFRQASQLLVATLE